MRIVTRTEWGHSGWNGAPSVVPDGHRSRVVLHYAGAAPVTVTGPQLPRMIDGWHKARGWSGIGYNFVVDQSGAVFEGRGWTGVGAHVEGHNSASWGILIGVGGDQKPTPAAYRAAAWLITQARARTGRVLPVVGHRDLMATLCPGTHISAWIRDGMQTQEDEDVELTDTIGLGAGARSAIREATGQDITKLSVGDLLQRMYGSVLSTHTTTVAMSRNEGMPDIDYERLAFAVVDALPPGTTYPTADEIAAATVAAIAKGLAS